MDSLEADGITLNVDDQATIDARVTVVAWSVSSITNANIVTFNLATSDGFQDITGLGFNKPDVMFIMGQRNTTVNGAGQANSSMSWGIGAGQIGGSPANIVRAGGSKRRGGYDCN